MVKTAAQRMDEYEDYAESHRPTGAVKSDVSLNCGASCARKTLIFLNVVFITLGATIMGLGVWILNSNVQEITSKDLALG
eukprot:CAMPEP_0183377800 /NCGR_PEP_ID=MMETSP0164_2-20130417/124010_1 /TAXON_ID=221442 /ORGANISM="Coccolithus pelagicus ssp braarudi, Strain PLY182g" /LENGTH=79 /DNA_ID=CAMNT_0025555301 /DNA_START=12 /DNA_END=248 /DNA_ORIENTATION=-